MKQFQEIAELHRIPETEWYKLWVTRILKGAAKDVQIRDREHGQDIFALWELLQQRFPAPSKLDQRIYSLTHFVYKPYRSMRTHCSNFRDLSARIDEEVEINTVLNHHGRLPDFIPEINSCYQYLLDSVQILPVLFDKVRTWELERNPQILDAGYVRTQ